MSGDFPDGRGRLPVSHDERNAFTLIELLVVVAIIGILAALLLPTLAGAKQRAFNITCQNNLKQLQMCWHMYPGDFNDYLVPNAYIYTFISTNSGTHMKQFSWCAGNARVDTNTDNIKMGLLFPYNTQVNIYHCPADLSTIEDSMGNKLPQLRNRSYNMSQSVNAYGELINPSTGHPINADQPCFEKLGQITNPAPSQLFVFIDENEETLYDAQFGFPQPPFDQEWWDMPADRHFGSGRPGANLSFADGHVEHWKWNTTKESHYPGQWVKTTPDEYPDYRRIQAAMRVVDW
jgi:prepilin-type N-terminal cleavage/methylation domain-containing protein/prepilin-type processing-associated H-X9-DG protein